jgi:threonylcarbamoyladenosine tRNA methylthiotransferase MtaB
MGARYFEQLNVDTYKDRTRAFLKIQEGCSQFCSYCIIPYARGPIRSRNPEEVLDEVKRLSESGFKEIVLTGIHVASYGKDIKTTSLLDIIKRIHPIEGIERIRLGSIEPTTITEEFVNAAKELNKLCPHYHISLQSGCDTTLKRMNRKYTSEEYKHGVNLLRQNIKDVSITTDVMVGFPGESDAEYNVTYNFLNEINLTQMHIFKFSPRKGTPAATYEDQVAPEKKDTRSSMLINLSKENTVNFNRRYIGNVVQVLIEQEAKEQPGFVEGLTPNYVRVVCKGSADLKGYIINVEIIGIEDDYCIGKIVE